ncbi:MAG TPA: hypothetical protein VFZ65_15710 [Planctomycetota bacterium]|nr:hypothetical protein [Planctomycetota bacterium]
MSRAGSAERVLVGCLGAYAAIGGLGSCWLLAHRTVPDWILPVACLLGALLAATHRTGPAPDPAPARPFLVWLALATVVTLTAVLAYGSLATPSREWDGAVAWDLKTAVLRADPSLEQPFFREPAVYCHSRDYPLLQPLAIALVERAGLPGRLLFPLAHLLLVAAVLAAARRAGAGGNRALLFATACAVTPMLVNPTGGGFDSGYGDAVLAAVLAAAALGVAGRIPLLVALAVFVAALQKPEGLPYAALLVAACALAGDSKLLRPATGALCVAGALALSMQHDLLDLGRTSTWWRCAGASAGLGAAVLGLDAWLTRRRAALPTRLVVLLLALPLAVVCLAWLTGQHGSLGVHVADGARPLHRIGRLPAILLAIADWGWLQGRFGLTFVLPLVIAVAQRRQRAAGTAPALRNWLLLAVPLWCAAFLLSPIDDLEHHLRSTLPRLLLHWCGVAWCWSATQPLTRDGPQAT